MLRTINIAPTLDQLGAEAQSSDHRPTIIKHTTLEQGIKAFNVLENARTEAEQLINRATADAHALRATGYREGLRAGMFAALSPLTAIVSRWNQVESAARQDAAHALHATLQSLILREPTLGVLLDTVLDSHFPQEGARLRVRVPAGAETDALEQRCRSLGLVAIVEDGEPDAFSLCWDDHVWTAHLDDIADDGALANSDHADVLEDVNAAEICREALLDVASKLGDDVE